MVHYVPPGGDRLAKGQSAIRIPKTAEVVADQIRGRIVRGELKEGDFLPPEGAMMSNLAISRPTLREAIRILEAERLISVVRGARTGARVHQPVVENAARYAGFVLQAQRTTIHDVYEARLAIEPFVVRQLAEQPSAEAVARLSSDADRLTKMVEEERYVDFMAGLAEFHHILVELSGNQTLSFVTSMLQNVVARHQIDFLERRELPEKTQKNRAFWGLRSFRKLIDLIGRGAGAEAEAHWRLHLTNANASWVPPSDAKKLINVV